MNRYAVAIALAISFITPAAARSAQMDVDGAVVERSGTGDPALVILPAAGGGAAVWRATAQRLARNRRVYTVTLPGFDGVPAAGAPYLPAYERCVVDLIARERLVRPVLVGHSLGGHLALRIAERHPGLVGGVVAVDALPVFPVPAPGETWPARERAADTMHDAVVAWSPERFASEAHATVARLVTDAAGERAIERGLVASDRSAFAGAVREMQLDDLRPDLAAIEAPVLVLAPAANGPAAAYFTDVYRTLYAGTRRVAIETVVESRHFIMLDQPERFVRSVERFVETTAR